MHCTVLLHMCIYEKNEQVHDWAAFVGQCMRNFALKTPNQSTIHLLAQFQCRIKSIL